jgi:hypothetical protein
MAFKVLEMVPGTPEGVYRVEVSLGRGVTAVQWITTTADRVLRREAGSHRWQTEHAFPDRGASTIVASTTDTLPGGLVALPVGTAAVPGAKPGETEIKRPVALSPGPPVPAFRLVGTETLSVPAGAFETLKIECLDPDGDVASTCWFADGVGLVKRVSAKTGATQELESRQMPNEAPAPPAAPPPSAPATAASAR